MGSEHHDHSQVSPKTTDGRLLLSLTLNLVITLAEIIGGVLSNSLALLSDAVHNLSDTSSLGISWLARRISRKKRTKSHSFGFKRAEVLASLVNTVALVGIGLFLLVEAVRKFLHPEPVVGKVMLAVAVIGLLGNLATAWLLHRDSKNSLNIRSAYLHIVMDTLSSVGVVVAAILLMFHEWYWIDPFLTLMVSAYVLYESWPLLKTSVNILMQGTPSGVEVDKIIATIQENSDVVNAHHIHIWTTDGTDLFLEAHVTLSESAKSRTDIVLARLIADIKDRFSIAHVTLQMEFSTCTDGECSTEDLP
ncbi:cation diffusion facilitator family transporter [Dethiosulfovibrio salsuginis]|uniref:Cobalt-zinc-cadmium efflux system protein n=1 Tax=Dethiosulfovibrio salsuginis TaxID=561720 RepID=A0A1X7L621_9BACT|nr:cation diffusion facilitator family transporter [Dethiosulfovibrio salsuginis]SMG48813.1 cobalt-zinc-cadmium efflux system protein [Dethiosulfovibrio salsuginis]